MFRRFFRPPPPPPDVFRLLFLLDRLADMHVTDDCGHRQAGLWRLLHACEEKAEAMLWLFGDASSTTRSATEPVVLVIGIEHQNGY
jgi:hypothetical protein